MVPKYFVPMDKLKHSSKWSLKLCCDINSALPNKYHSLDGVHNKVSSHICVIPPHPLPPPPKLFPFVYKITSRDSCKSKTEKGKNFWIIWAYQKKLRHPVCSAARPAIWIIWDLLWDKVLICQCFKTPLDPKVDRIYYILTGSHLRFSQGATHDDLDMMYTCIANIYIYDSSILE